MKCVVCRSRKGKRQCPAKGALICPQCCGEKRVVEIACPPDCSYLQSGQSYHIGKRLAAILDSHENPRNRTRFYQAIAHYGGLMYELEKHIVSYASSLTSLSDRDVQQAVEALRKSYETEERGIVFEHSSTNPLAQALVRELRDAIEAIEEEHSPRSADLIEALWAIEQNLQFHVENDEFGVYLDFIRRNHPEASEGGEDKGIIVTG